MTADEITTLMYYVAMICFGILFSRWFLRLMVNVADISPRTIHIADEIDDDEDEEYTASEPKYVPTRIDIKCEKCGAMNTIADDFCGYCGSPLCAKVVSKRGA